MNSACSSKRKGFQLDFSDVKSSANAAASSKFIADRFADSFCDISELINADMNENGLNTSDNRVKKQKTSGDMQDKSMKRNTLLKQLLDIPVNDIPDTQVTKSSKGRMFESSSELLNKKLGINKDLKNIKELLKTSETSSVTRTSHSSDSLISLLTCDSDGIKPNNDPAQNIEIHPEVSLDTNRNNVKYETVLNNMSLPREGLDFNRHMMKVLNTATSESKNSTSNTAKAETKSSNMTKSSTNISSNANFNGLQSHSNSISAALPSDTKFVVKFIPDTSITSVTPNHNDNITVININPGDWLSGGNILCVSSPCISDSKLNVSQISSVEPTSSQNKNMIQTTCSNSVFSNSNVSQPGENKISLLQKYLSAKSRVSKLESDARSGASDTVTVSKAERTLSSTAGITSRGLTIRQLQDEKNLLESRNKVQLSEIGSSNFGTLITNPIVIKEDMSSINRVDPAKALNDDNQYHSNSLLSRRDELIGLINRKRRSVSDEMESAVEGKVFRGFKDAIDSLGSNQSSLKFIENLLVTSQAQNTVQPDNDLDDIKVESFSDNLFIENDDGSPVKNSSDNGGAKQVSQNFIKLYLPELVKYEEDGETMNSVQYVNSLQGEPSSCPSIKAEPLDNSIIEGMLYRSHVLSQNQEMAGSESDVTIYNGEPELQSARNANSVASTLFLGAEWDGNQLVTDPNNAAAVQHDNMAAWQQDNTTISSANSYSLTRSILNSSWNGGQILTDIDRGTNFAPNVTLLGKRNVAKQIPLGQRALSVGHSEVGGVSSMESKVISAYQSSPSSDWLQPVVISVNQPAPCSDSLQPEVISVNQPSPPPDWLQPIMPPHLRTAVQDNSYPVTSQSSSAFSRLRSLSCTEVINDRINDHLEGFPNSVTENHQNVHQEQYQDNAQFVTISEETNQAVFSNKNQNSVREEGIQSLVSVTGNDGRDEGIQPVASVVENRGSQPVTRHVYDLPDDFIDTIREANKRKQQDDLKMRVLACVDKRRCIVQWNLRQRRRSQDALILLQCVGGQPAQILDSRTEQLVGDFNRTLESFVQRSESALHSSGDVMGDCMGTNMLGNCADGNMRAYEDGNMLGDCIDGNMRACADGNMRACADGNMRAYVDGNIRACADENMLGDCTDGNGRACADGNMRAYADGNMLGDCTDGNIVRECTDGNMIQNSVSLSSGGVGDVVANDGRPVSRGSEGQPVKRRTFTPEQLVQLQDFLLRRLRNSMQAQS